MTAVDLRGRLVAVIGANGFLGAPLVDGLVASGAHVHAFDHYSRGPRYRLSPHVKVIQGDLLSGASLAAAVAGCQDVFHFTSLATPAATTRDPALDVTTDVTAGVGLLSTCVTANVQRVFYASSGGTVYGSTPAPHREDSSRNPLSPYGIGKVALESYLSYFALEHGLQSVSLRISNPYGPGQRPDRAQGLIPIALRAARDGRTVTQLGDGSMTRDYVFLPDLVKMVLRVASDPQHQIYNLGSGVETPVQAIFDAVEAVTGTVLVRQVVPPPPSFPSRSVLDTSAFTRQFGNLACTPLAEGLARTWEEIRSETVPLATG